MGGMGEWGNREVSTNTPKPQNHKTPKPQNPKTFIIPNFQFIIHNS
jgi:hypothetical protein